MVEGSAAVSGVSEDRAPDVLEVDPNLMGSSGFGAYQDKADPVIEGGGLDFADRFAPIVQNGHFFSMDGVAADRGFNRPIDGSPSADGQIELINLPLREGLDELLMRNSGLSREEHAGRLFIESMDNSRSEGIGAGG